MVWKAFFCGYNELNFQIPFQQGPRDIEMNWGMVTLCVLIRHIKLNLSLNSIHSEEKDDDKKS